MGLSDKIGRRKVMLFFSISGTIITAPILTLLAETTYVFAAFGMMFGLVFVSRLPLPQGSSGRLLAGDEEALAELATAGWIEAVGTRTPGLGSISAPVLTDQGIVAAGCLTMPLARHPLLLLPQHTEGALPVLDPEFSQDR